MAGQPKREPISKSVDPGAVSDLGGEHRVTSKELYEGRGYEAPKNQSSTHNSGSQGKH